MTTFQYLDEGNSEAQDRLATSYLLAQSSTGLARTGVLAGLVVTQTTTASGAVLVAAGAAPVQASVGTGVALLVNDTLATLDVFTANPMGGLPRNDIVAFDSVTKALIAIIGTPNAAPTDPTVPATACALARLRHAASATTIPTAKIDTLIVNTTLLGGSLAPQAYTPVLTGSGSNPANYAATGRYIQVGKLVTYWFSIVCGAGFAAATGTYYISLPVTAYAAPVGGGGGVRLYDTSTGTVEQNARVAVDSPTKVIMQVSGSIANVAATIPWAWAPGDIIDGYITYESA